MLKYIVRGERTKMTLQELKELGIECWPDNDGGLWYWGEHGKTEKVEETKEWEKNTTMTA